MPAAKLGESLKEATSCQMDPANYISYPDCSETQLVRHSVVMVRWNRPHVPQPDGTPLPTSHLSEEERGRIFSVYLRPWVLSSDYASAHVPLLADIDILVSDVLATLQFQQDVQSKGIRTKRLLSKQHHSAYVPRNSFARYPHVDSKGEPFQRCYAKAWTDYRCGHVVSKYAALIIQQFSASHLADSLEAAENDHTETSKRERTPLDTSWMSLTAVHDILQRTASVERSKLGSEDQGKASKFAHQVEAAESISEKLWSVPTEHEAPQCGLDKQGSISCQDADTSTKKENGNAPEDPCSATKNASLYYKAFKPKSADEWLRKMQAASNKKKPSAEQLHCIQTVV